MKDRILVVTSFEEEEEEEEEEEIEIGGDEEQEEEEEEGEEDERVIDYGVSLERKSDNESMHSDSNSNDGDNNDRLVSDLPPPFSSSSTSYLDFRALFISTSTSISPSSTASFLPTENKDVIAKEANQRENEVEVGNIYSPPVTDENENEKHVSSMGNMLAP